MKKFPLLVILALLLQPSAFPQQFTSQTNTVVTIPPLIWRGLHAQVVATQLLALTNANGSLIIPPGLFTNRTSTILIRVEVGTNGLTTLRARIQ